MSLEAIFGRSEPAPLEPDEIQQQRVRSARRNRCWTELDLVALTRHGKHFTVDADEDAVYTPYDGAVWNDLGGIEFAEASPLFFIVEDGRVRLYEKYGRSWGEIMAAGAR